MPLAQMLLLGSLALTAVSAQGTVTGLSRYFTCRNNYLMDTTGRVIIDTGTVLAGKDPEQVKALLIKFCLSTKTHLQVWRRLNPQGLEYRMVWEYVHSPTVPEIGSNGVVITLATAQQFTVTADDRLGLWSPRARKFSIPYAFHASQHQMYRSDFAFAENHTFSEGSSLRLDPLKWPWSFTRNIGLCFERDCSDFRQVSLNPSGIVYLGLTRPVFRNTIYGRVEGTTITLHNSKTVHTFLGIRYAKPPVGRLRFAKPEIPDPNAELVNATMMGPACPQRPGHLFDKHAGWNYFAEDCLHLNIYTPEEGDGPFPVLVWFHGPQYWSGANIEYPGHFLAAKGTVVVVPNFRLGILGFLSTEDDVATGNWGLWDQRMALIWVSDNIGFFKGDRTKVTISSSANAAGLHVVSQQSTGLFHRAIYQSSNEYAFSPVLSPRNDAERTAQHSRIQCPTVNTSTMVNCLRTRPWQDLINSTDCTPGEICARYSVIVDGPGGVLSASPMVLRDRGQFANVPLMAGINLQDGLQNSAGSQDRARASRAIRLTPSGLQNMTRTEFVRKIRNLVDVLADRLIGNQRNPEDVVQALDYVYTNHPFYEDKAENREAFIQMVTDMVYGQTMDRVCKNHARTNPVYQYVFAYRSRNSGDPQWMRAPRLAEIPYVWGHPYVALNTLVRHQLHLGDNTSNWSIEDIAITDYIQELWHNFVNYGNPTRRSVKTPDGREVEWTRRNLTLNYLYVDWKPSLRTNYRQRFYAFWTRYLPYLNGRT